MSRVVATKATVACDEGGAIVMIARGEEGSELSSNRLVPN